MLPVLVLSFSVFFDDPSIRHIELRDARIGRPGAERGRVKEELTMRLLVYEDSVPSVTRASGTAVPRLGGDCSYYMNCPLGIASVNEKGREFAIPCLF